MDINNGETWAWHHDNYNLRKSATYDDSHYAWKGVTTNQEDISYIFDEATPIKDCGDLAYHVADNDSKAKESKECRETSLQAKRRRMLHFNGTVIDQPFCIKEMSSVFLKSKEVEYSVEEILPEASHWASESTEDLSAAFYEDQAAEGWLAECLNDAEINDNPDDMNFSEEPDVQIDITEFCDTPPESQDNTAQEHPTETPRKIVFKERKSSYIQTSTKLASSIAYPFAFIKPCGVRGDVTLKDINQMIRTPPPSKFKQSDEDHSTSYATSAFSGKLVVGKTKIHTDGGKGSITIMRTKG